MMLISHRGNINKKNQNTENTLLSLHAATKIGYGAEFDLRKSDNKLIVSHDPSEYSKAKDAKFLKFLSRDAFLAINIKEFGIANDVASVISGRNGFVFDFELIDKNCKKEMDNYRKLGFNIAARLSDNDQLVDYNYDYIWVDEISRIGSIDLSGIELSRCFYVSPELHGMDINLRRKDNFAGVCTDNCGLWAVTSI